MIYVIRGRAADGGLKSLNDRILGHLTEIQNEFTRHMADIHDDAKKSINEDDDLDVLSIAWIGIAEQKEIFADHERVMSRIAVQTFLEIAEEPVEAAVRVTL